MRSREADVQPHRPLAMGAMGWKRHVRAAIPNECDYPNYAVTDPDEPGGHVETTRFGPDHWPWVNEKIEIRKAGGAERDTDFDWVTFSIPPVEPQAKADCVDNWETFGFRNQGLCVQFVNTGKDSRP